MSRETQSSQTVKARVTRKDGYKGVGLSKIVRRMFFSRNNLLRNVGPLKDSFVKKGKRKFYLGEEEPVKVAG